MFVETIPKAEENEGGVKWTTDARLLQLHVVHICAVFPNRPSVTAALSFHYQYTLSITALPHKSCDMIS